jgi:HAD superfamily hydrolase (TIGR01509 family)
MGISIIKNAKGRKFIFSNSIASYINKILAKFEITNEFEKVYDIFEFQLKCKPDPIVFDIVSKEHNINTSNFILIDDSEKTLESARRYGIDVINPIDLDYVYEQ